MSVGEGARLVVSAGRPAARHPPLLLCSPGLAPSSEMVNFALLHTVAMVSSLVNALLRCHDTDSSSAKAWTLQGPRGPHAACTAAASQA